MLEEAVEFTAVQRAPRTVQVISGLCLLPCVIVVEELENKRMNTTHRDYTVAHHSNSKNRTCYSKTYELQRSHANIIQHRNLQWKERITGNSLHFGSQ